MVGEDSTEDAAHVPEGIKTRYPIEPERILTALLIVIILGVTVAGAHLFGIFLPESYRFLLGVLLSGVAGLYLVSIFYWLYEVIQSWRSTPDPVTFGPEAVQVRILTIDAERTVQNTVNELPDTLTDRHVVAETPIEIEGATVHVVPDEFECMATDKGRALEWARRTLSCEKEYVLFLDEDTLVPEFPGLPDADLIQFREYPMKTDSWWTFWAEIIRMGWQLEQMGFERNDIPMYTWGGGLAVRKQVEDEISWNFESLIEDSVFAWLATRNGASYNVVETRFRDQAPLSLRAMLEQRRRWVVGTIRDERYLPFRYHILFIIRNVVWGFTPVLVVVTALTVIRPVISVAYLPRHLISGTFLVFTLLWIGGGIWYYGGVSRRTTPVIPLFPIISGIHSLGALWGLLTRPEKFHQTEKEPGEQEVK
jgi:hypothetical protein